MVDVFKAELALGEIHDDCQAVKHLHISEPHSYVWLEREYGQASTMDLHAFCSQCGAVRITVGHGRPVSFFVQGVSNVVRHVASHRSKITECQARLMAKAVTSDPDLNDSYSTGIDMQLERFISIVHYFRPELEDDDIVRALFMKQRKQPKQ